MKAYPLIYSRTKNFDFVPDFLARPKDLNCQLALKYVKNAMNNLDFIQGIRYTAFPVEQYCVCGGIACISAKLIDKLAVTVPDFKRDYPDAAMYLRDCKGRAIACFIGVAIPKSEVKNDVIPDISLEKYWEIYLRYLRHKWSSESNVLSEQLDSPDIEIKEKRYGGFFEPQKEAYGSCSVIRNYLSNEQNVLDYFFHAIFSGSDESIITEVQSREEWNALNFKTAVVTESLYKILKANPINFAGSGNSLLRNSTSRSENKGNVSIKRTPTAEFVHEEAQKKTSHFSVITAVVVLVFLILILLMFRSR